MKKPTESDPVVKEETGPRQSIEDIIVALCTAKGGSISPTDAAQAVADAKGDDEARWQSWLPRVRAAAIGMARKGDLVILRKGKPADPDDFRGVYRLGLPRKD
ncbi:DUF3253 domain-containing protein [Roseiarcaceae bacterium H3SJ34-1]|uniref:DUF3253 domain-containing protein n=1 Tax=Terripilifer ovatus TaxID=3032367 RepID=UPI003AB9A00C|nr:DUF3253 domain-containing protein [Roseiarcaceae bacterium H3SJ34-1]